MGEAPIRSLLSSSLLPHEMLPPPPTRATTSGAAASDGLRGRWRDAAAHEVEAHEAGPDGALGVLLKIAHGDALPAALRHIQRPVSRKPSVNLLRMSGNPLGTFGEP